MSFQRAFLILIISFLMSGLAVAQNDNSGGSTLPEGSEVLGPVVPDGPPSWEINSVAATGCNSGDFTFNTTFYNISDPTYTSTIVEAGGLRYMNESIDYIANWGPHMGPRADDWSLFDNSSGGPIDGVWPIPSDTPLTVWFTLLDAPGGNVLFSREVGVSQCNGGAIVSDQVTFPDNARFYVTKDFTDDNPAEVEVTLNCFTGLPITQSQTISEAQEVNFIVESFADGELDCNVTESDVLGYSASYTGGNVVNAEACEFADLGNGQYFCQVTNTPDPVEVSVFKDWIIEGEGGDSIDPYYRLVLACRGEIVGGSTHGPSGIWRKELYDGGFLGTSDAEFNADVVPDWDGGTACWVLETVYDSAVEVNNGCGSNPFPGMNVELAGGDSCTVVNTVFFEGIPTLSQYGMAVLALLMLGLGFVGFRRFV